MGCIALVRCVLVLRCGLAGVVWCGIRMQAEALLQPAYGYHSNPTTRKLLNTSKQEHYDQYGNSTE